MAIRKEVKSEGFIKWFSELDKDSGKTAGGKGANLAEIYNLKIAVPPGFVVTAQAYDYFIEKAGIKDKINKFLDGINYEDTKQLTEITKTIRKLIEDSKLPSEMEKEIIEAYSHLDVGEFDIEKGAALDILKNAAEPIFVAVRSSATTEDLADASFAGQQDTFLNIKGKTSLIEAIKKCFSSLFTPRATYYRNKKGFKHAESSLAVVVQKMIDADKSGVIFSKDPNFKNDNIIIESVWGLGEGIVSGKITPDKHVVSKDLEISNEIIANKKVAITRSSSGSKSVVKLTEEKSHQKVLKNHEIKKLAEIALKLEEHYQKPQDIEFAIENSEIYIVQTRPITTIAKRVSKEDFKEVKGEVVLEGLAASPGIASGKVKIIKDLNELNKIQQGDILVTLMTNPDMVVTMQKSAAIITDEGGLTAHAAIVSREMGIPCFSKNAKILTNKGFMKLEEIHKKIKSKEKLLTLSFNTKTLKTEWKKIKNASKRKGKTISISISKNGKVEHDILRTTPEHNFFNLEKRISQYKEINEILESNKIVYASLSFPKFNIKNKFNNLKAYLCGAIFSDGYLRIRKDGSASTVFVQKNIHPKKEFIRKVKENFKKVYNYELKEVNKNYFYCYKQSITKELIKTQENITSNLLSCDKESVLNYLAGIIDGDGNFIKRGNAIKVSLDKKKPQILDSLIVACMRLGIVYRIKTEKNQYRFYLCSKINLLKKYFKRLIVKDTKKVTGDEYLSSKDLFSDISIPGRKGIKSFVKKNCLLSKEKIEKKVMPYLKDKTISSELKKILNSDLRALRIRNLNKSKNEFVFNIEVEKNNNYIVFSDHFSPIIVKNCIVGTGEATTRLKENEIITVDGYTGKIYKGKTAETAKKEILPVKTQTKTEIKVIVDLPSFAQRAAKTGLKKVGLTRIEGIIAESGKHPEYFLKNKQIKEYEEIIFKGINQIAEYFEELWIRTSDIRTDEFKNLKGAPETVEANPMLGFHGIRYSLKNPEIFKAELNALKRVAEKGKTIGLLLPQVILADEVAQTKKILQEIGFDKAKLGVMVETPAAVQIIKDLIKQGIKFISFGTNDLTQYMLAIDRGNEKVQDIYNEMHPAVLYQLSYVIRVCKREGVETSICGQSGSRKEMVKYLVESGIDSISVNADMASEISEYANQIEKELVKNTDKEPRQYELTKQKEEVYKKEEIKENIAENEKIVEDVDEAVKEIEEEKQEYIKEHPEKEEEEKKEENDNQNKKMEKEKQEVKEVKMPVKFNPGMKSFQPNTEELQQNIKAIEEEKQEYIKEHPEGKEENKEKEEKREEDNILDIF